METKIGITFVAAFVAAMAFGSASRAADAGTDRQALENNALRGGASPLQGGGRESGNSTSAASDTGTQRLVMKKNAILEWDGGAGFSYYYRSNPLNTNGDLAKKVRSGVFEISAYGTVSVGNYELFGGVYTPRAGYSLQNINLTERSLKFANYLSQRLFTSHELRFDNLFSVTPTLEFSNIIGTQFGTEDYQEFFPSVTFAKVLPVDDVSSVRLAYTTGYRFSSVDSLGGTVPGLTANRLDNWTNSFSGVYVRELPLGFVWQGFVDVSNRLFVNGQNRDRSDWLKTVGGSLSYAWKYLRLSGFMTYSQRSSTDVVNDYKNLDIGLSSSVFVSF
jgi:hypothetical protein